MVFLAFFQFLTFVTCTKQSDRFNICLYASEIEYPSLECAENLIVSDHEFVSKLKNAASQHELNTITFIDANLEVSIDLDIFQNYISNVLIEGNNTNTLLCKVNSEKIEETKLIMFINGINVQFLTSETTSNFLSFTSADFSHAASVKFPSNSQISTYSFNISLSYLTNVTSLDLKGTNGTYFDAKELDTSLKLSKNKMKILFSNKAIDVTFIPKTDVTFKWASASRVPKSGFSLELTESLSVEDCPVFHMLNPNNILFVGSISGSENTLLGEIISIPFDFNVTVNVNSSFFPFSLECGTTIISLSQSTTFHGEISALTSNRMFTISLEYVPTTKSNSVAKVLFNKPVLGRVSIKSSSLDVTFQDLTIPYSFKDFNVTFFGIGVSVGPESVSHVKINNIHDDSNTPSDSITVFNYFTVTPSSQKLTDIGLMNGSNIIECDSTKLNLAQLINVFYSTEIPEECKSIFGFKKDKNCLRVSTTDSSIMLKSSAFSEMAITICLIEEGEDKSKCDVSTSRESDLSDLIGSGLLFEGMNNFTIQAYMEIKHTVNLSNVVEKISNASICLIGDAESSPFPVTFGEHHENIYNLTLNTMKINEPQAYNMENIVFLDEISFDTTNFTFGKKTNVYIFLKDLKHIQDVPIHNLVLRDNEHLLATSLKFTSGKLIFGDQFIQSTVNCSIVKNVTYLSASTNTGSLFNSLEIEIEEPVDHVPGITIVENADCQISFKGKIWSQARFTSEVKIFHDDHNVKLIYSSINQGSSFKYFGSGKVTKELNYNNKLIVCLYDPEDADPCTSSLFKTISVKSNETDSIADILKNGDYNDLKFEFYGSTKEKPYRLNVDFFEGAASSIVGAIGPYGRITPSINLTKTEGIKYPDYSLVTFENAYITVEQPTEFTFGELEFKSKCSFSDDMKKVNITVADLICDYNTLQYFNNITITDNLIVEGSEFPKKDVDVYFVKDNNPYNLKADLSTQLGEFNVTIGTSIIKLNSISFHIERSPYYDAALMLKTSEQINLNVNYVPGAKLGQMPKIAINGTVVSNKLKLNFTGQWEDTYDLDVIQVNNVERVYLTVEDIIPIQFNKIQYLNVTANSQHCGFVGPVIFEDHSSFISPSNIGCCILNNVNHSLGEVDFRILTNFSTRSRIDHHLWVTDPFVNVSIGYVTTDDKDTFTFKYGISLTEERISTLTIKDLDPLVSINPSVTVDSLIEKSLDNESSVPIFENTFNILTTKTEYFPRYLVFNYNLENNHRFAHGFNKASNCMGVEIVESTLAGYSALKFFLNILPSKIPFTVGFYADTVTSTEELVIHVSESQKFSTIDQILPTLIHEIEYYFMESLTGQYSLDLNKIGNAKKVYIRGNSKSVNFIPTNDKTVNVTTHMVKLTSPTSDVHAIYADVLNMTYTEFSSDSFSVVDGNINVLDINTETLASLITTKSLNPSRKFATPFNLRASNVIIFLDEGWIVKQSAISNDIVLNKDIFSDVNLIANGEVQLSINATSIHNVNFNIYPTASGPATVYVGARWTQIDNFDGFKVNTNGCRIKVVTPSFEIPDIFTSNDYSTHFGLPTVEKDTEVVNIVLPEVYTIESEETFDFTTTVVEEQRVAHGTMVIFNGQNASLKFEMKFGYLETEEVSISQSSEVGIDQTIVSKSLSIESGSYSRANISFGESATIQMKWLLSGKVPEFHFDSQPETIPSEIIIRYDDSSVDAKQYNSEMYNNSFGIFTGDFQCSDFINNLHVKSDVSYFDESSPDYVLSVSCKASSLMLTGSKRIGGGTDTPTVTTSAPTSQPTSVPTSQLTSAPTRPPTETTSSSSSTEPTIVPTETPTEEPTEDTDSTGISAGTVAGVTIGAIVGVILIGGFAFYVYKKRSMRLNYNVVLHSSPEE